MTETTAKAGASTKPVDEEPADKATPATGRAAVGRATVPGESPSPKFTRAPGMPPPPDEPPAEGKGSSDDRPSGVTSATAAVPVVTSKGTSSPSTASTSTQPRTAAATPRTTPGGGTTTGTLAGGAAVVGAARVGVGDTGVRPRTSVASAATRGPRRARLNLKRIDPWSVMKFSFAVSVVLFIVVIVATSVLYLALDAMGVWNSVNGSLNDLGRTTGNDASGFRITAWGVIGTSMLVGAVNVVLFTALATLGAFIYNVCADLVGGIELTLAERD